MVTTPSRKAVRPFASAPLFGPFLVQVETPTSAVQQSDVVLPEQAKPSSHALPFESAPPRDSNAAVLVSPNEDRIREEFAAYKDHTNALLVLIALLLGLVALLFPIVTYLTSILPGNRIIDEAKRTLATLDERFAELSRGHQERLVDQAIDRLVDEADFVRQNAATYLGLNVQHEFSDKQIFDICNAAEHAPMMLRVQLFAVLAGRDSEYVTRLFSNALHGPEAAHVLHYIVKHYAGTRAQSLRDKLFHWVLSKPRTQLSGLIVNAAMTSPAVLLEFLNDPAFVNELETPEKASAMMTLRGIASTYRVAGLDDSFLANQLRGRLVCFVRNTGGIMEEAKDPGEADLLIVYNDGAQSSVHVKTSKEFLDAVQRHKTSQVAALAES